MPRSFLFSVLIALTFSNCNFHRDTTRKNLFGDSITKVNMNLSAFGVESDDFPSIVADIDFVKRSGNCKKTYYNPKFKPSMYKLSGAEIDTLLQLLKTSDLEKLRTEYSVSKSDQPTSTITIYAGQRTLVIKDYGLEGDYPLQ